MKQGLIAHLPALAIADVLGSTEGGMGTSITTKDTPRTRLRKFTPGPTTRVFTDDGREVERGIRRDRHGGQRRDDPDRLLQGPRQVGAHVPRGRRRPLRLPRRHGDRRPDGTLVLSGGARTASIRGGEKIFPEEVEEALKLHLAVEDALVFGVPDDRFGQRVVGVVSLSAGRTAEAEEILTDARGRLASYKLPKAIRAGPAGAARTERQGRLSRRTRVVRVTAQG